LTTPFGINTCLAIFPSGISVPLFLKYIEDKDLWKFSLPFSKEVSRWFAGLPSDFNVWDRAVADFENEKIRNSFIAKGAESWLR